jgi:hypothetical protein
MRSASFSITAAVLAIAITGCASNKQGLVLERVGPEPAAAAAAQDGTLVVFSAPDRSAHFNTVPYRPIFSEYKLLSDDGKLLRTVSNRDNHRNSPAPVTLAPGNYRVTARANGYGEVTVPILVSAGRTTMLHLEGQGAWADTAKASHSKLVCFADGQVVGYRADEVSVK